MIKLYSLRELEVSDQSLFTSNEIEGRQAYTLLLK